MRTSFISEIVERNETTVFVSGDAALRKTAVCTRRQKFLFKLFQIANHAG